MKTILLFAMFLVGTFSYAGDFQCISSQGTFLYDSAITQPDGTTYFQNPQYMAGEEAIRIASFREATPIERVHGIQNRVADYDRVCLLLGYESAVSKSSSYIPRGQVKMLWVEEETILIEYTQAQWLNSITCK